MMTQPRANTQQLMTHTCARSLLVVLATIVACISSGPKFSWADESDHTLPAIYLIPSHPVYSYLERLSAKGLLRYGLPGVRPWTRTNIARMLLDVAPTDPVLTRSDRDRWAFYAGEFADEIVALGAGSVLADIDPAWWSTVTSSRRSTPGRWWDKAMSVHSHDDASVRLQVEGGAQVRVDTATTWSRQVRAGGWLRLGQTWSAQALMVDDVVIGPGAVSPSRFGPEPGIAYLDVDSANALSIDDPQALMTYHSQYFTATAGVFPVIIGHGRHTNIALSGKAPSVPNFRLTVHPWRWFEFTWLQMWLQSGVPEETSPWKRISQEDTDHLSKYYVAHRLGLNMIPGVEIGLGESLIYGARGLEPMYLIPVIPFRAAQHAVGDLDNLQMWADIAITRIPRTRLYGAFFIDELAFIPLFSGDDSHNWWAWQTGVLGTDTWGLLPDVDVRVEYTRANPWAYRHRYPWNTYDTFAMDESTPVIAYPLGFFAGHNSDHVSGDITWRPVWNVDIEVSASQTRRGSEGSVAEQYSLIPEPFLFGNVTRTRRVRADIRWEFRRDFIAHGGAGWTDRRIETDVAPVERNWTEFMLGVTYRVW
jgi:hypothetical protein